MKSKIAAGVAAGLIAGIIFTLLAQFITTTAPDGERTSLLITAATAIHSHWRMAGWIASLVYSVAIGGFFGWLLRTQTQTLREMPLMFWGGLYGIAWWVLSGLIVVPVLHGSVPLSSDALAVMRPVIFLSLPEHVVYGVILGFAFARITTYLNRRRRRAHAPTNPSRRAA